MRYALAAALAMCAGCLPAPEHQCSANHDCSGGICVSPPGACAFVDPACGGGLRFGEGAGELAGACLPAPDAGVDAPTDAAIGADEDRDGVADTLDNCPHVHNPLQQDTTEPGGPDGVGNICDPEPTRDNRLVLFDGFNGVLSPSWTPATGARAIDGRLHLDPISQLVTSQNHPRHVAVVFRGRGVGASAMPVQFGAGAAVHSNGEGAFCAQVTGGNGHLRVLYGNTTAAETDSPAIDVATPFTVTVLTEDRDWSCRLEVEGRPPVGVRATPMETLGSGWIAFVSGGVAIEIDFVAVIALADQ